MMRRMLDNAMPVAGHGEHLRRIALTATIGLYTCLTIPVSFASDKPGAPSSQRLETLIRLYGTDQSGVSRFYDLPASEIRFDRLEELKKEWVDRLESVDFGSLPRPDQVDFLLLQNELRYTRQLIARDRQRLKEMSELLPFRTAIQKLETARWRMESVNGLQAAGEVSKMPDLLKVLRKRLEEGRKEDEKKPDKQDNGAKSSEESSSNSASADDVVPLKISPSVALRAAEATREIRRTLKDWFEFYDGYQPEFSWWLKKPYEDAAKALGDYATFLKEDLAGVKGKDEDPLIGDPIGEEALREDIAAEMLPYSPRELVAIGEREFAWCQEEMKKAAAQMGLGDDWKAALARVKSGYAPPGHQDESVAGLAREAIRFVKDHDLVTVPPLCEETWRLTMISPEGQRTLPFAAYGGQKMMVAYANQEMKHEDKLMSMRGNNQHFTRIVTAHELIPGHHLQRFMSSRHHDYRGMFSTPFYVEGWALYWEMLLWDERYASTPEDRIGMLFWRMHRAARIIVSLKFQLGSMTPEAMIDFLVDRVGHERMGATSEVRRFIGGDYSPLYQCGYMIGGLQLRALQRELTAGDRMTIRQFNDAVLRLGPIPIEMVRASLTDLPLTKDFQPGWKFAEALD